MKSVLKVLLCLFLLINCSFVFSCGETSEEKDSTHIHSFIRLKTDAEYHWYECSCREIREKEKHVYYEYVCSCGLQSYSPELTFVKKADGKSYGISACQSSAEMVFIPTFYESLPVTTILEGAFKDLTALKKVVIANGLNYILEGAFSGCENLETVELPETVIEIGDRAFKDCKSISKIKLPKNLTTLGESAFQNCSSLQKIEIDRNLTYIGEQAFLGCNSLTKFEVESHNEEFKSVNGVLYSRDLKVLICFANGKTQTAFTVPKGTEKISDYAFFGNQNLTALYVPRSLIEIGHKAVYISNLQTINYSAGKEDWQKINFDGDWLFSNATVTVYPNGENFVL